MDLLKRCAEIYKKYVGYNYTFVLDCGIDIDVEFRAQYFYHLAGLHYLTDIVQVDRNKANNSSVSIFKRILNGRINDVLIQKSKFYSKIYNRLTHFLNFDDLMTAKIIVDFDSSKVNKTSILSRYLLYKQYGNQYVILGLKYDIRHDIYIPETFIVEDTDYYIKNQIFYNIIDVKRTYYKSNSPRR